MLRLIDMASNGRAHRAGNAHVQIICLLDAVHRHVSICPLQIVMHFRTGTGIAIRQEGLPVPRCTMAAAAAAAAS